jgi:hypothetical protein
MAGLAGAEKEATRSAGKATVTPSLRRGGELPLSIPERRSARVGEVLAEPEGAGEAMGRTKLT